MLNLFFAKLWPSKFKPVGFEKVEPTRMKLADFRFADRQAAGTIMPIPLPSGADSGEWLRVLGPYCDAGVSAMRDYAREYTAIKEELAPLDIECAAKSDWTKYNSEMNWRSDDLNDKFASVIVIDWSLDDEFSPEAVAELMQQYKGLSTYVAKHFQESRKALLEK